MGKVLIGLPATKRKQSKLATMALLLLLIPSLNLQAEPKDREGFTSEKKENAFDSIVDSTHGWLSKPVIGPARWLDNFFGDQRVEEESKGSRLKITSSLQWEENAIFLFKVRFRTKIILPNLKKRVKLIIERESEEDVTQDINRIDNTTTTVTKTQNPNQEERTRTTSALRWVAHARKNYNIHLDVGVRSRLPLEPFVKLHHRRRFTLPRDWTINLTHTVYWKKIDGYGTITRADFEKKLNEKTFFRYTPSVEFAETTTGVHWQESTSLFHVLTKKKAISFDAGVSGKTRPAFVIDNYTLGTRYRQNIYRPWLFYEINPQVNFPNSDDWKPFALIAFRLEMTFGDYHY